MGPYVGAIGIVKLHTVVADAIEVGEFVYDRHFHGSHAVVYLGDGQIVEAVPGGVRITALSGYDGVVIRWSTRPLTSGQAAAVVDGARQLVGTPYNYLLYPELALWRLGVHRPFVRRWIGDTRRLDCSQLADLLWDRAGVHIFTDHRPEGFVSPGMLDDAMTRGLL